MQRINDEPCALLLSYLLTFRMNHWTRRHRWTKIQTRFRRKTLSEHLSVTTAIDGASQERVSDVLMNRRRGDFGALTHVVTVFSFYTQLLCSASTPSFYIKFLRSVSLCNFHASCAFHLIACSICRAALPLHWVRDARFASLSKSLFKLWWC